MDELGEHYVYQRVVPDNPLCVAEVSQHQFTNVSANAARVVA